MSDCTFVMLAGPNDAPFLELTFNHLTRTCSYNFHEVIIVADDLPSSSADSTALLTFQTTLERLLSQRTLTRCVFLSDIDRKRRQLARKYFGGSVTKARDHRGVPLFGWAAGIEAAETKYVVHFDSDILLHQAAGSNWINMGIGLAEEDTSALFISPLPGPPTSDGSLHGQDTVPSRDSHGNFRFKTFSSRRFLVSKERLESLLPTPAVHISRKRRALMQLGHGNSILPWEVSVSRALLESDHYRVHLASPTAWTLHSPDHGPDWVRSLPDTILRIEQGRYPNAQAGHYDLILSAWR
uniref:Uncharacterized protein n=1 Tax=Solibacter usitatus (strain Ellin6076) TaxID=234267 RepID=Q01XK6_SOLUE